MTLNTIYNVMICGCKVRTMKVIQRPSEEDFCIILLAPAEFTRIQVRILNVHAINPILISQQQFPYPSSPPPPQTSP